GTRADGMVSQGLASMAPKRRWPRFRLRTLLLAVAVLGVLLAGIIAAVPWILWRYRVAQALEIARSGGPELSWSLYAFGVVTAQSDEFLYLLSDRERVLGELLRSVDQDPNDIRRIHAIQTMQALLKLPCPSGLRKRSLGQAIDLATSARLSSAVEAAL